jgi:predicted RND superfamily exporter protein
MVDAIKATLSSVFGSSATTIAGFLALCFMTFTMGLDLGLVMAKGVLLGVVGSVTVLPALILTFDKVLRKLDHKPLMPNFEKISNVIVKFFPAFLIVFVAIIPPALFGYHQTNSNVNYELSSGLPSDTKTAIANAKLDKNFGLSNVHMILTSSKLDEKDTREMTSKLKEVDGVKSVLNLENIVPENVPFEVLPDQILEVFKSDKWELTLAVSEYKTASDEIAKQITEIGGIIKSYDETALLIGESSLTQDMINLTSSDFQVVNTISIIAIFIIIAIVTRSLSLPVILITVIEFAIFVNLAISYYTGTSLSFIAPICISTIQLGATVDYAILMTTRYNRERLNGKDKKAAAKEALVTSIPSILVSGTVLFAATIGVAVYSRANLISSLCMLLARGAVISIIVVPTVLAAMLMFFDPFIIRTTVGMKKLVKGAKK